MFAGSPSSTLLIVLKIAPVKRRIKKLVPVHRERQKEAPRIASAIRCATLIETGTAPESGEQIDK
jgi:heme exporter protein D